jgi:hypothetical protein
MNYNYLLIAAAAYFLYSQHKKEQSTKAFLSGGDYNDIFGGGF